MTQFIRSKLYVPMLFLVSLSFAAILAIISGQDLAALAIALGLIAIGLTLRSQPSEADPESNLGDLSLLAEELEGIHEAIDEQREEDGSLRHMLNELAAVMEESVTAQATPASQPVPSAALMANTESNSIADAQIADINSRYDVLKSELEAAKAKIAISDRALGLEPRIATLEAELAKSYDVDLTPVHQELLTLRQATEPAMAKIIQLESEMEAIPGKLAQLELALQAVPAKMAELEQAQQSVPEKLAQFALIQQAIPKKIEALENQLESIPEQIAILEEAQKSVPETLSQFTLEQKAIPEKITELELAIQALPEKIKLIESEIEEIPQKIDAVRADLGEELTMSLDGVREAVSENRAHSESDIKSAISSVTNRLSELEVFKSESSAKMLELTERKEPVRVNNEPVKTDKIEPVKVISEPIEEEITEEPTLETEIQEEVAPLDIENNEQNTETPEEEFELLLQPIFTVPEKDPIFFEAYTRAKLADGEYADTASHIQPAIENGLITKIDNVMFVRGFEVARRLKEADRDVGVFCNMSIHTLRNDEFFKEFIEALSENSGLNERVVFEFDQEQLGIISEEDQKRLEEIGDLGFRFSLDNVNDWSIDIRRLNEIGFRYVKLNAKDYLKRLQASSVGASKLQKAFSDLGLNFIIEKIENEADYELIVNSGALYAQGNFLAESKLIRNNEE